MTKNPSPTCVRYLSAVPGAGKTRVLVEHLCLSSLSKTQRSKVLTPVHESDIAPYYFGEELLSLDVPSSAQAYLDNKRVCQNAWSSLPDSFFKGNECNFLVVSPTLELMRQTFENTFNFWSGVLESPGRKTFLVITSSSSYRLLLPTKEQRAQVNKAPGRWPDSARALFGESVLKTDCPVPVQPKHLGSRIAKHLTKLKQGAICTPLPGTTTSETLAEVLNAMYDNQAFGNIVFCTHATFSRLPLKALSRCKRSVSVYFDEARSLVDHSESFSLRLTPEQQARFHEALCKPTGKKQTYIEVHTDQDPSTTDCPNRVPLPYWEASLHPRWMDSRKNTLSQASSSTQPNVDWVRLSQYVFSGDKAGGPSKFSVSSSAVLTKIAGLTLNDTNTCYVKSSKSGRTECVVVSHPAKMFSGFDSVYLFAAYFEASQMYALLKVSPLLGKAFVLKRLATQKGLGGLLSWSSFSSEAEELQRRASRVNIVPLTASTSVTSKEKTVVQPWFASSEVALAYLKELKGLPLDTVRNKAALLKARRALTAFHRQSGKSAFGRPGLDLVPFFLRQVANYIKAKKLATQISDDEVALVVKGPQSANFKAQLLRDKDTYTGLSLLSVNRSHATMNKLEPYLLANDSSEQLSFDLSKPSSYRGFYLLPHQPHGLNKYLTTNVITYLKSCQPKPSEDTLMRILTTRADSRGRYSLYYSSSNEIPTDLAIQSATRTSLRAAGANSPVYIFVPDLHLAKLVADRLSMKDQYPTIHPPLTDVQFEHDVFNYFHRKVVPSLLNYQPPLLKVKVLVGTPRESTRYDFNLKSSKCTKKFQVYVKSLLEERASLKNKLRRQKLQGLRSSTLSRLGDIEQELSSYCL